MVLLYPSAGSISGIEVFTVRDIVILPKLLYKSILSCNIVHLMNNNILRCNIYFEVTIYE
ncbi:Uncharacterised protein [Orientia tsutsugamushi]|uniref:Uncharacterized protein n=2 Tax=Orientia tsutsugamushi TaxID=784 RepID=A0A0F3NVI7_ORITS|nr:hypothetical protein OTSTA716_2165 [Orientia tsutsugamushi str. TA716]SPM45606.1 Uncharacterised protein [Orientia tsutsugamushi]